MAGSPHFGRDLRVVLLVGPDGEEQVILASTDTAQHAEEVVRYYRLRYQIKLVIRDARQHTGLTHCQARSQEKLDFHLNMSVASVNLLRLLAQKAECSPRTYRREAYNRLLVGRLFSKLDLSAEYDRMDPRIQSVVHTGRMAVDDYLPPSQPARTIVSTPPAVNHNADSLRRKFRGILFVYDRTV